MSHTTVKAIWESADSFSLVSAYIYCSVCLQLIYATSECSLAPRWSAATSQQRALAFTYTKAVIFGVWLNKALLKAPYPRRCILNGRCPLTSARDSSPLQETKIPGPPPFTRLRGGMAVSTASGPISTPGEDPIHCTAISPQLLAKQKL